MKVLFISGAKTHDYQCDAVLHGLRETLGPDCVDYPCVEFMYQGTPHGGYTLWGLLPDLPTDRSDILNKIRSLHFDYIIYGSVQRCRDLLDVVREHYPRNRIAFIDGEDDDHTIQSDVLGAGLYFKREQSPGPDVLPIQFAVPSEKIVSSIPDKTRLMAALIPGDLSTYGYTTEQSYRDMYACARFGRTKKKGGWDCFRHYEILMMGCVPYFESLETCPLRVMTELPKDRLLRARALYDYWPDREAEWQEMAEWLLTYTRQHLTTEALAERLLSEMGRHQ